MNYEEEQLNKQIQKEREEQDALMRPERAEKVINFLDKIKAYDFVHSLCEARETVSFEDFKSFLIRLNGMVRDVPIIDGKIDGANVEITGGFIGETVLPPQPEDKEELLKYAFDSAKELNESDNSYMLPAVINSLHLFADGNGRTSRIIHSLFSSKKESFRVDLEKALSAEGRFDFKDINPALVNFEIEKVVLARHGWYIHPEKKIAYGHAKLKGGIASARYPEIDQSTQNGKYLSKFYKLSQSTSSKYLLTAVVESLTDEKYSSILLRDKERPNMDNKLISPQAMLDNLVEGDWLDIFKTFYELIKEQNMILVDIFKNPNDYCNDFNEQESLKDMFIRKINEEND